MRARQEGSASRLQIVSTEGQVEGEGLTLLDDRVAGADKNVLKELILEPQVGKPPAHSRSRWLILSVEGELKAEMRNPFSLNFRPDDIVGAVSDHGECWLFVFASFGKQPMNGFKIEDASSSGRSS